MTINTADQATQVRHQAILDILGTGPQTLYAISEKTGIPYYTVRRDVQESLIQDGYVKRETYKLGRADVYAVMSEFIMPRIQDVDLEDYLFRLINGMRMANAVAGTMAKFDIVLKTYEIATLEWAIREYGDPGNTQQEKIDDLKLEIRQTTFEAKRYYQNQLRSIEAFESNRMLPMTGLWRNLFNLTTRIQEPEQGASIVRLLKQRVKDWKVAAVNFPIPTQELEEDESSQPDNLATAG